MKKVKEEVMREIWLLQQRRDLLLILLLDRIRMFNSDSKKHYIVGRSD